MLAGILLWPLGGLAYVGHTAGPKADMVVAVAGPLTHVPMTGLWLLLLTVAQHTNSGAWSAPSLVLPQPSTAALMWQAICAGAVAINISLAAFNLLVPAYPLDGGRLLADSLLACGVPPPTAAKVTVGLAAPLGLGIVAWSLAPHHVQITLTCVGAFILVATWELWSHVRRGTLDQHPLFAFRKSSLEIVAVSC